MSPIFKKRMADKKAIRDKKKDYFLAQGDLMDNSKQIFGMLNEIDIEKINVLATMRNEPEKNRLPGNIEIILDKNGYIHPFTYFDVDFNFKNEDQIAKELSEKKNLRTYLESVYKYEEIRKLIKEE